MGGYAHGPCSHFGRPLLLQNGPRDLGRPFCVLPLLLLRWGPCCVPTLSLGLPRFPPPFLPGVVSPGRPRVGVWPLTPPPFFLGWPRPALTPLWAIASATAPPICPGVASPGTLLPGVWPGSPPPFFLGTSKIKHPVLQSHASSSVFPWGPLSGIPFGRCWFLRLRLGWHFSGQPNVWTCVRFLRLRAKGADMGSPFCQKRPLRLQICTVKAMKDRPPRSSPPSTLKYLDLRYHIF